MRKNILRMGLLSAMLASVLGAQDMAGDWQGTLKAGIKELRIIVKVAPAGGGRWDVTLFSIDQGPDRGAGIPARSATLQDSVFKFRVDALRGAYEGMVSADGSTITGTWTQGLPLPLVLKRATPETAWNDPSPHTVQMVTVDKDVKLEVLDWGGSGRPLVLLAGLGNTAHVFDNFAQRLTGGYHVYGITRRGYGASSVPADGYAADRLGDDVLAVLDFLHLNRPVLAGHSIAGEELSSVGSRHPEKVAGLIYLDAGYGYAYYDRSRGYLSIDLAELQKTLEQLQPGKGPADTRPVIQELLQTVLPGFEKDLQEEQKDVQAKPAAMLAVQASVPMPHAAQAIIAGGQKYTNIPVPILAIYAVPHDLGPLGGPDPAARAAQEARDEGVTGAQAKAFEAGVPSARVVRLAHANHYVFLTDEAAVLREMNAFLGSLP
jgi:pimeloyl-ACP methyl ester carboxylesterase